MVMVGRSPRAQSKHCHGGFEEESIYRVGAAAGAPAQPVVYDALPEIAPKQHKVTPKEVYRRHNNSSQVSNIFNPIKGPRDAMLRAGIKPFDHVKYNAERVRDESQMNHLRKAISIVEEEAAPSKPPRRLLPAPLATPTSQQQAKAVKDRDFLAKNRKEAANVELKSKPTPKAAEYCQKPDFGKVPKYLQKRNMERDMERRRAAEESQLPPGMRIMAEEERVETLDMLKQNQKEVMKALQKMPFVVETPGQMRRKQELEARLQEVDKAIAIFSKPKVLVQA